MGTPWGESPPFVYYAEPIDKAAGQNFHTAAEMAGALATWGCTIYRPSTAWRARTPDPRVEEINRAALYRADLIVAYLSETTPSIGVPAEIEAATSRGIAAVVHYTGTSFALAGNPLVTVINDTNELIGAVEKAHRDSLERRADAKLADTGIITATDLPGNGVRFVQKHQPADPPPDLGQLVRAVYQKVMANNRYGPRDMDPVRLVIADGAQPPNRAYDDDAGIDLTTAREIIIEPGQYVDIPTQVEGTQLPLGYWAMITGRSSALRKWRLHIPVAIIDPGWRGPLFVGVWNLGGNPVTVKPGDRLGQLILIPNNPAPVQVVTQVDEHPRGLNGFGSSG